MPEAFTTRTLRELTRVIFTRLLGMIVIVALLTGGTYYACKRAKPIYQSEVTILVKQPKRETSNIQEVSPDRSLAVFLRTQHQIIKSDLVLSRTMALLENPPNREDWLAARSVLHAAKPSERDEVREKLDRVLDDIDQLGSRIIDQRQEDLARFRKNVEVETPGGETVGMSEVFTITVWQRDGRGFQQGQQARMAADILAKSYIDRYWQVQAQSFKDSADLVQSRLADLKENMLEPAEKAMNRFLAEKLAAKSPPKSPTTQADNVLNPADVVILEQLLKSGTEAGSQIVRRRFEEEKIRLQTERASASALQEQLSRILADPAVTQALTQENIDQLEARVFELFKPAKDPKEEATRQAELTEVSRVLFRLTDEPRIVVPQDILSDNDIVNKMKKKLADLIIDRNRLRGQYAPTYRELISLYIEIVRAKLEIVEELRAEKKSLDVRLDTIDARLAQFAQQITLVTEKLDAIAKLLPQYDRLQAELRMARANFAKLETELLQAQALEQRARKEVTIQVIDPASVPDPAEPAIPNTPVYTIIAAAVAVLLALAYAFLADYFDHTLRSIHEVERYLGTTVLGSISKAGRRLVQ